MNWSRDKSDKDNGQIDDEIAFHVDALTAKNVERGMSPDEARRQAMIAFGGTEQAKQQVREVHVWALRETVAANVRSAMRFVRRAPGFAAAVMVTLALGIGANSAVFSAVDAILLRPLPFPHGDELVRLHQLDFRKKIPETFVAGLRLEDWNAENATFQSISGYYTGDATLTSGAMPEKMSLAFVAPRFLRTWGVVPELGRDLTANEEREGGPVMVSNRFWRSHLQADPQVVGKTISLDRHSYVICAVLPASFLFPDRDVDIWEPSATASTYAGSRDSTWFTVIGRLKPGVPLVRAQADLSAIQARLARQYPKSDGSFIVRLEPLKMAVLGSVGGSLWLVYGSVSLLLLIACVNIAGLLMARTAEREHEIAIRYSLGASRAAIVGQLLTEVFLLALGGALLGLIVAAGASQAFARVAKDIPRIDEIVLNWRIVAYTLGCAVTATLVCGLFPALRGTRRNLSGSLSHASRTQVSGRSRWQWTFVGVQVSLAVAMLIGAGLLLRSFRALGVVDAGFDPDHVLALRVSGDWGETVDMGKLTQRIERTLAGLRTIPGVEAAATSATVPGNSVDYPTELTVAEGAKDNDEKMMTDIHFVSPGYFETMRIPLLQGKACEAGLGTATAVVNRSFAAKYFSNAPVVGYHLQLPLQGFPMPPAEIRGIVGDAREEGMDTRPQPTAYWCVSAPTPEPHYLVRTAGSPGAMADVVRRKVHELEPGRSVFDLMPLDDHLSDRLAENRLRTMLLTLFAATAISLACIGLYGTISYLGRTRRREVGLRLALGALPGQIVGRFLLQGLRVSAAGCLLGLLLGAGLSRLIGGMLYGVSPLDPATYAGVLALALGVSLLASLLPAMRAARVNPTQVLREE